MNKAEAITVIETALKSSDEHLARIEKALDHQSAFEYVLVPDARPNHVVADNGRHERHAPAFLVIDWAQDCGFTPIEFAGEKLKLHVFSGGMARASAAYRNATPVRINTLLAKFRAETLRGQETLRAQLEVLKMID